MRISPLFSCFHWTVLFHCCNHGAVLSSAFSPRHLSARRLYSSSHHHASLQQEEELQTVTPPQQQEQQDTVILANDEEFIKPLPDKRHYRAILLPNGLRALLVSSPQSDVEAGALHVQAGHFDDLRPGLAHFHEHMLFLGTAKYPSPEEFETYLAKKWWFVQCLYRHGRYQLLLQCHSIARRHECLVWSTRSLFAIFHCTPLSRDHGGKGIASH